VAYSKENTRLVSVVCQQIYYMTSTTQYCNSTYHIYSLWCY